jgi:preprotein translocase subunit YajC
VVFPWQSGHFPAVSAYFRACGDGRLPPWHNSRLFPALTDYLMNLLDFLIPAAHAQAAGAPPAGLGGMSLLFPIVLIAVMYFLMIRPQMKRAKEHRGMLEKLSKGDEVITSGGIAGIVTDIGDNFITVEVADNVRVRVQKAAVGNVLPKGTLKSA